MEPNQNAVESVELEELDVEIFAKEHPDCEKPRAGVYVIRIDRERVRMREPGSSGAQVLALAGKTPDTHKLFRKSCGGEVRVVKHDEVIRVLEPGFERFQTIPKDTTEGEWR